MACSIMVSGGHISNDVDFSEKLNYKNIGYIGSIKWLLDSVGRTPFSRQYLDMLLYTREEAYSIAIYRFPNVLFLTESFGHIASLSILYSGTRETFPFQKKILF